MSFLNYELPTFNGYFFYQFVTKLLEIFVFYLVIWSLKKRINFWHLFIFFTFIFHFYILEFHHHILYFPILIFNIFILISLRFEDKNYLAFVLIFLGSFWSFFINPMYFFTTSFGPMLFLILHSLLRKNIKFLLASTLAFTPFVLMYIFLILGTARFAVSDLIISESSNIYNFTIINSSLLQIFFIFFTFTKFKFKKRIFIKIKIC